MAKFEETIANWTPAQLQAFIQNISTMDPTQIPASFNTEQQSIGTAQVTTALDLSKGAQLQQDGSVYPPITVPGSTFTGEIASLYADLSGEGSTRASGSQVLAQSFDIGDSTDAFVPVDQRAYFSRIYLPAQTPVTNIHAHLSTVPSASAITTIQIALYKVTSGSGDAIGLTAVPGFFFASNFSTLPLSDWNAATSTGIKTYTGTAGAQVLDAGIYYGVWYMDYTTWTAGGLTGYILGSQSVAAGIVSGMPVTMFLNTVGLVNGSYSPGFQAGNPKDRVWFGLS